MPPGDPSVDDVLANRIAVLEARLGAVDDELAALRSRRRGSMLEDRRCPACGGGELLHVRQATQMTDVMTVGLGLDHELTWRGIKVRGTFEYFVCRACRLVETHATALDEILDRIGDDSGNIVALSAPDDAPPAEGPYR